MLARLIGRSAQLAVALCGAGAMISASAAETPYDRGVTLLRLEVFTKAAECFDQAVRAGRSDKTVLRCRGFARMLSGGPSTAVYDFTAAIRLDPKDSVLYYGRGCARQFLGDIEGAVKDFNESIRLDPGYLDPRWERLLASHDQSARQADSIEVPEALRLAKRLGEEFTKLNDTTLRDLGAFGGRDLVLGERVGLNIFPAYRAFSDLFMEIRWSSDPEKLALLVGSRPSAEWGRAAQMVLHGEFESARAVLEKAIRDSPNDAMLRRMRGALHLGNGDMRAAVEDFVAAAKLDSSHPEQWWELSAEIHSNLGDREEAARERRAALRASSRAAEKAASDQQQLQKKYEEFMKQLREFRKQLGEMNKRSNAAPEQFPRRNPDRVAPAGLPAPGLP